MFSGCNPRQEGYNSTATGRQEDILGLLDKDQTGSMNDALGKDDSSDDPLRVLVPSLHAPFFHFTAVYKAPYQY
jgi:hypothetical protein